MIPLFPSNVIPVPTLISLEMPFIVTDSGPTVSIPVILASPSTYNLYPDFAVVPIPTFLVVLIPIVSTAQVPAAPTFTPVSSEPSPKYLNAVTIPDANTAVFAEVTAAVGFVVPTPTFPRV